MNLSEHHEHARAGGGWLLLDYTLRAEALEAARQLAQSIGREHNFRVIDFDCNVPDSVKPGATLSILGGSPTDIAANLLNLLPPSPPGNPGAEFYRQSARHALTVLTGAMQAAGETVSMRELSATLQCASAVYRLEAKVPRGTEAHRRLIAFLDAFRTDSTRRDLVDVDRMKNILGGMAGRLALFAQGDIATILDSANPDIRLDDVIKNRDLLYVRLPAGDALAQTLARVISSELSNAQARVSALPGGLDAVEQFAQFEQLG